MFDVVFSGFSKQFLFSFLLWFRNRFFLPLFSMTNFSFSARFPLFLTLVEDQFSFFLFTFYFTWIQVSFILCTLNLDPSRFFISLHPIQSTSILFSPSRIFQTYFQFFSLNEHIFVIQRKNQEKKFFEHRRGFEPESNLVEIIDSIHFAKIPSYFLILVS